MFGRRRYNQCSIFNQGIIKFICHCLSSCRIFNSLEAHVGLMGKGRAFLEIRKVFLLWILFWDQLTMSLSFDDIGCRHSILYQLLFLISCFRIQMCANLVFNSIVAIVESFMFDACMRVISLEIQHVYTYHNWREARVLLKIGHFGLRFLSLCFFRVSEH